LVYVDQTQNTTRVPLPAVNEIIDVTRRAAATFTCLATVGVATIASVGAALALDRLTRLRPATTSLKA
jgi:hypothetical protein